MTCSGNTTQTPATTRDLAESTREYEGAPVSWSDGVVMSLTFAEGFQASCLIVYIGFRFAVLLVQKTSVFLLPNYVNTTSAGRQR